MNDWTEVQCPHCGACFPLTACNLIACSGCDHCLRWDEKQQRYFALLFWDSQQARFREAIQTDHLSRQQLLRLPAVA